MNKEELEMFLLDLYNTSEPTLTEKGKQKIIETIEELQDRIDKAIEYIEKKEKLHFDYYLPYEKQKLLNILKGSDNNG